MAEPTSEGILERLVERAYTVLRLIVQEVAGVSELERLQARDAQLAEAVTAAHECGWTALLLPPARRLPDFIRWQAARIKELEAQLEEQRRAQKGTRDILSEVNQELQAKARGMTYNGRPEEAAAKHTLFEAAAKLRAVARKYGIEVLGTARSVPSSESKKEELPSGDEIEEG